MILLATIMASEVSVVRRAKLFEELEMKGAGIGNRFARLNPPLPNPREQLVVTAS
jgi:hypothetical protein